MILPQNVTNSIMKPSTEVSNEIDVAMFGGFNYNLTGRAIKNLWRRGFVIYLVMYILSKPIVSKKPNVRMRYDDFVPLS